MTTLSKNRALPLVAALLALVAVTGAIALKPLLKLLRYWKELQKKRQARIEMVAKRGGKERKLLQLSLYALPDLREDMEPRKKLESICQQMNTAFPCIKAGFSIFGSKEKDKAALLGYLGKPDMTHTLSHCWYHVADDCMSWKLLMHSSLHKMAWCGTGGPFCRGFMEMTTDLAINLEAEGKEDPILQIVFLKFKPSVTDDSEIYATFQECVAPFSECKGISAQLTPFGHGKLIKEDFMKEVQWNDASQGMTHVLLVAADSPEDLKELQNGAAYKKWLTTEMPHLNQEQAPAVAIFIAPLTIDAKC